MQSGSHGSGGLGLARNALGSQEWPGQASCMAGRKQPFLGHFPTPHRSAPSCSFTQPLIALDILSLYAGAEEEQPLLHKQSGSAASQISV